MKIYLDLLPEKRKQEIKRKKLFRSILHEEFLFSLPIVLFIIMLLNIYYILTLQRNVLISQHLSQQSQEKYQQLNVYEEKFKQINSIDQELKKIQDGHLRWQNIFLELSRLVPDGVYVSNISTKNFKVFLNGKAKTRDSLIDFKNKLETSACFEEINVPLSNLVVKDDVDFQIDLNIKEECLKQK